MNLVKPNFSRSREETCLAGAGSGCATAGKDLFDEVWNLVKPLESGQAKLFQESRRNLSSKGKLWFRDS
jgi:hypothetical protein